MADGYSYEPEALRDITHELNVACSRLDTAIQQSVRAPDAGESSEVVGDGISDLIRMGTAMAHVLDEIAGKVHAASGAYADIENTAANQVRVESEYGMGPGGHLPLDGVDPAEINPNTAGADRPAYAPPPAPDDTVGGAPGSPAAHEGD